MLTLQNVVWKPIRNLQPEADCNTQRIKTEGIGPLFFLCLDKVELTQFQEICVLAERAIWLQSVYLWRLILLNVPCEDCFEQYLQKKIFRKTYRRIQD